MRLTELMTIYLSIGAPFGVASFLIEKASLNHTQSLTKAMSVMFLWPIAICRLLLSSINKSIENLSAAETVSSTELNKAQTEFNKLLFELEDLTGKDSSRRYLLQLIRNTTEQYAETYWVFKQEFMNRDVPAKRVMELCRIDGREGKDLLLAGHCFRRRNLSRVQIRLERLEKEFLQAMTALYESVKDQRASEPYGVTTVYRFIPTVIQLYGRAIKLFSILERKNVVHKMTELLDVSCNQMRSDD
jgi:hypothetical protein